MSRLSETEIDAAILASFRNEDGVTAHYGFMTYVVRNRLSDFGKSLELTTAQVLYRLKKLEKIGKVERVPSSYAVMICWRAKE